MANGFDYLGGGYDTSSLKILEPGLSLTATRYVFSTAEPAGSVHSFTSDATHGSNCEELFEDDLPPMAVISRLYDVLEELMMVMRARGKADSQKEAKHTHESPLAKNLTLFGEITPSAKAAEERSGMEGSVPQKLSVGFEFGQKKPVTFTAEK
ncbi:uncharacterized protein LAJ45_00036 [Morchella importuna]|uniref:uncharacterized protein n=1 Tax=Morchella importuna TaxID=1174673 RepID=UPI001E8E6589|nr:uncharacterized protein LAJ45_00036 [Morchella importuna]KAH8155028.1 hypothetical protein LAJ45_00036 [Morchella importuna]